MLASLTSVQGNFCSPETIPLNGIRFRCINLTRPTPVIRKSKKFNGKVCWYGFSDKLDYEITGVGPFVHRRILFRSQLEWPTNKIERIGVEGEDRYFRYPAFTTSDERRFKCISELFPRSTIRGILFDRVERTGVTVLEDRRFTFNGTAGGVRKQKKTWNAFGLNKKGMVLKYQTDQTGSDFGGSLEASSDYQHIYVVDIFQYGVEGMDYKIEPKGVVKPESVSSPAPSVSGSGRVKKPKVDVDDDLQMHEMSRAIGSLSEIENFSEAVRVNSVVKLYWYDPK